VVAGSLGDSARQLQEQRSSVRMGAGENSAPGEFQFQRLRLRCDPCIPAQALHLEFVSWSSLRGFYLYFLMKRVIGEYVFFVHLALLEI
jgi:hypothetical protein